MVTLERRLCRKIAIANAAEKGRIAKQILQALELCRSMFGLAAFPASERSSELQVGVG